MKDMNERHAIEKEIILKAWDLATLIQNLESEYTEKELAAAELYRVNDDIRRKFPQFFGVQNSVCEAIDKHISSYDHTTAIMFEAVEKLMEVTEAISEMSEKIDNFEKI